VREHRHAHLKSNTGKAAEDFIHIQYLLCDRFGVSDQQRTCGASQSVKLYPRSSGPAAFFTDQVECCSMAFLDPSAFYGTYVSSSGSGSLGVEKSLELYRRTQS
jgi:hypothetical protein